MIARLWARRSLLLLSTIIIALAFIVIVAVQFSRDVFQPALQGTATEFRGGTAYLQRVSTAEARAQGLSGVKKMAVNQGLLMDFQADDTWGIWMKDMLIPLDILWLDKDKQVIYIVRDVQPELSITETFRPSSPARYVIELNASAAERYMVKVGDVVHFE